MDLLLPDEYHADMADSNSTHFREFTASVEGLVRNTGHVPPPGALPSIPAVLDSQKMPKALPWGRHLVHGFLGRARL